MRRHDLDPVSLVAGLLFVGLGVAFLSDDLGALDLQLRWVWPTLLIGLGIVLLIARRTTRGMSEDVEGDSP